MYDNKTDNIHIHRHYNVLLSKYVSKIDFTKNHPQAFLVPLSSPIPPPVE